MPIVSLTVLVMGSLCLVCPLTWIVMGSDHGASCVVDWGSHGVTVPCVSLTGVVMGSLCLMCR